MKTPSSLSLRFARLHFRRKQRIRFYRKLDQLLRNGVPLQRALRVLWEQASSDGRKPDHPMAIALSVWMRAHRSGKPLARALEGWIPEREQMLIEAGELAGELAIAEGDQRRPVVRRGALLEALDLAQTSSKVTSAIVGGLAYPTVLFFATLTILYLFGTKIVPPFADILEPERWTGMAAQMHTLSGIVRIWTIPAALAAVGAIIVYFLALPRWTGRLRAIADQYPPLSLYRLWVGTGFMLSLAALVRAGVQIPDALRKLKRAASPYLTERLDAALVLVRDGKDVGTALKLAGHGFPDREIVHDLQVYAGLYGFDEMLGILAREWLSSTIELVQLQTALLRNLFLVVMALVIAWLGWGLFDLQQQVTAAAGAF